MWALIKEGTVKEVTGRDPTGRFHPDFQWVACDESVQVGYTYDGESFSPPPGPDPANVEMACEQSIDRKASEVRARFITAGIGQEATYLEKAEEARAYKAATTPTDSDYPLLEAESARRGMTMTALADEVIARRTSWINPAAANVEAERVGGKHDVRAASTVADKEAARDNAIAALDAIQPQ